MLEYTLKIHSEAIEDINEATDWYDAQKQGLGKRFQAQVVRQINKLRDTAPLFNIRYDDVRCVIIKKFPFMVHYTVNQKTGIITVYAVVHTSRRPKVWSKR